MLIMSIGLAAVLHNPALRGSTFFRTILLVPNITSVLAIAIVFGQLFGRDFGMVNFVLGLFGVENIDWVQGTTSSHVAIAAMIVWRWTGYNALIFLAAMLAIPNELYESASLDGAGKFKQFIYVTLPSLRNTITFVLIVGTIGGLQVFAEPLILGGSFNGGDSGQFSTLTLFLFEQAFVAYKWGYAAAIGIMITVIVAIVSVINFFITRKIAGDGR
jgi:cellobiose transport system permease protein